ncbi:photosystem reaction center subunit H [Methanocella sp. CWC-04]|uniref:Photosystem reaction center subunit H n=1 Tax=Methanooceanicella nereidis TaxID=2052831 RepID=A0AAP2W5T7_9EURY|nr:PRC-barrel domain-containing protein [Methanocella sp. CWC-04]MCD1295905.1 photosystem reaction center subunit H [Methanocella sp. CWC-04]
MIADITSLFDLNVYTDKGKYVGKVNDVQLESNERKISGLALVNINRDIFDVETRGVIIPYRWVLAAADVVIIRQPSVSLYGKEEPEEI